MKLDQALKVVEDMWSYNAHTDILDNPALEKLLEELHQGSGQILSEFLSDRGDSWLVDNSDVSMIIPSFGEVGSDSKELLGDITTFLFLKRSFYHELENYSNWSQTEHPDVVDYGEDAEAWYNSMSVTLKSISAFVAGLPFLIGGQFYGPSLFVGLTLWIGGLVGYLANFKNTHELDDEGSALCLLDELKSRSMDDNDFYDLLSEEFDQLSYFSRNFSAITSAIERSRTGGIEKYFGDIRVGIAQAQGRISLEAFRYDAKSIRQKTRNVAG